MVEKGYTIGENKEDGYRLRAKSLEDLGLRATDSRPYTAVEIFLLRLSPVFFRR